VADFRLTLQRETAGLTSLCQLWTSKLVSEKARISEEVEGKIRCVLGQAGLVMSERFVQFSGLVDNCQYKQGEKETTCQDLRGFWEMIYFQVEDVNRKFIELKKIEANDWKMEDTVVTHKPASGKKSTSRKRSSAKAVASSGLKALIASKRKCLVGSVTATPAEKENISQPEMTETSPEKTFDGGFFTIKSPFSAETSESRLKTANNIRVTRSAGSDKLRKSVLTESAKRMSSLVSPFVSQLGKRSLAAGEKTSPVRGGVASVRRASLFDDDED